jgi:3-oxoacyl-[acyl-carrier-protein] synthase-3
MSFVSGLDIVSYLIHNGVYKNALIVSTDIASVGLNRNHLESFANFGDGACSFVVGKSDGNSCIESSHSETYSEGAHDTELIGGGSLIHPREYATRGEEPFLFKMDGRRTFRLSCEKIEPFLKRACCKEGKSFKQCVDECKVLVPHQASYRALSIVRARLGIPEDKMVNIVENYGNMISVSVPLGLHTAMKDGTLQRGEKYILVGFGAGLHLGFLKGVY